ncbi:MAG: glycosyltransferase family 1 protein [Betaproteobacteria bacterium]|nr:glycosyltransferase family 1 protein [Betaproteobacteria bacterium]
MPVVFELLPVARRSLRIAVVCDIPGPDGTLPCGSFPATLFGDLAARGHLIQVVRPRLPGESSGSATAPGGRLPALRTSLLARHALDGRWSRQRPDLVFTLQAGPLAWAALRSAGKLRIPLCAALESALPTSGLLGKAQAVRLRRFHSLAQATVLASESLRNGLAAAGFRRLHVVAPDDSDAFEALLAQLAG